jgi:hypothetical protein
MSQATPSDRVTIDRETYEMLLAFLNAEKSDDERISAIESTEQLAAWQPLDAPTKRGGRG